VNFVKIKKNNTEFNNRGLQYGKLKFHIIFPIILSPVKVYVITKKIFSRMKTVKSYFLLI